ncbi:MAG: hypothetical protein AB1349_01505 [Elusimicrobiota bacterium]
MRKNQVRKERMRQKTFVYSGRIQEWIRKKQEEIDKEYAVFKLLDEQKRYLKLLGLSKTQIDECIKKLVISRTIMRNFLIRCFKWYSILSK